MFADDLKLFTNISPFDQCSVLQNDLDYLTMCCNRNRFLIVSKCNVLTFCRRHNVILHQYKINDLVLNRVEKFRDLGVAFIKSLRSTIIFCTQLKNLTDFKALFTEILGKDFLI